MGFKEWREKRKEKKEARRDQYDILEDKLRSRLRDLDVESEAFGEVQKRLKENNIIRAESRESKRHISKQDKGSLLIKILGILGAAGGTASIIWAERQGMVFTGEKRGIMNSIASGLGKIFMDFKKG